MHQRKGDPAHTTMKDTVTRLEFLLAVSLNA
jgi:hypothetical protein